MYCLAYKMGVFPTSSPSLPRSHPLSLSLSVVAIRQPSIGSEAEGGKRVRRMGKCNKIRHIVRVRQMLRRWRMRAAAALSTSRKGGAAPSDVPAGHVAVCVGSSSRRFVVRASHLNHPVFRQLLRQAEEEYGFSAPPGPLSLPCDESLFEDVLRLISSSSSSPSSSSSSARFTNFTLDDLAKLSSSSSSSCCCDAGRWLHPSDALPLLHSHRLSEKHVW